MYVWTSVHKCTLKDICKELAAMWIGFYQLQLNCDENKPTLQLSLVFRSFLAAH